VFQVLDLVVDLAVMSEISIVFHSQLTELQSLSFLVVCLCWIEIEQKRGRRLVANAQQSRLNYLHLSLTTIIRWCIWSSEIETLTCSTRDYTPMTRKSSFHTSVSWLLQKISIMIHGLQNSFYWPEWVKFHRDRKNSLIFVFTQRNQPSPVPRRS